MKRFCILAALICWAAGSGTLRGDDAATRFETVKPVLEARCVSCHGPDKQEGGLRLDSLQAAMEGGHSGAAIVPGDAAKSLLVRAVRFTDPDLQMPPKDKLSDAAIESLVRWVADGAPWPTTVAVIGRPGGEGAGHAGGALADADHPIRELFGGERLDLWSLRKPDPLAARAARAPGPKDAGETPIPSSSQTIDALIGRRLAEAGVAPSPEADRRTLIRRLSFDLTGLPPTPEEIAAFLSDDSPGAYERLVDRLLGSPRYGERQAALWLDVVRYADTNGYERDEYRPLAWQYRDYVVRSFNQDKPFDQFIREQLAGDELLSGPPTNAAEADMLIATGYLRLGQWDSTAALFQEEDRLRAEQLADLTNTTASAFLGLTMSCCQCHDHKHDPLSQADHYRFRAFFAGLKPRDDLAIELPKELKAIARHNAKLERRLEPLRAEQARLNKDAEGDKERYAALDKEIAQIEAKRRRPRVAMGAADGGPQAPATHVFYQGDFQEPREQVEPGFVSVLSPRPAEFDPPRGDTTGRRLALADWIASPDNPWTARVVVNRIWQQHFGVGLVATPNDFGYSGARPTHPELLDWLAVEFMAGGWSVKELQRRMVQSATYRQSSASDAKKGPAGRSPYEVDPDNALLWRQNVRRLDAESLRDSLLAVSGLLLPYEGGKPRWPSVADELLEAQPAILEAQDGSDGGRMQGWYADPPEKSDVRSLFLIRKRSLPVPLLQTFDQPEATVSCGRRDTTVVAPQALMLLNSEEAVRYARALADRVRQAAGEKPQQQVAAAFMLALSRPPDDEELQLALDLLDRHSEQRAATDGDQAAQLALADLCRAVLNLNELVYID